MEKAVVTISRYWDNPKIFTKVTNKEISLEISLDDFKKAIKNEIGSVATTFTKAGLDQKIDKAFDNVIKGIKEESAKVII